MARVRVFELLLSHQRRSGLYTADVRAIALERRINLLHQHLARELLPAEKMHAMPGRRLCRFGDFQMVSGTGVDIRCTSRFDRMVLNSGIPQSGGQGC